MGKEKRPICLDCNTEMYPCGGLISGNITIRELWRCPICKREREVLTEYSDLEILDNKEISKGD